jgi:hypothetical protein
VRAALSRTGLLPEFDARGDGGVGGAAGSAAQARAGEAPYPALQPRARAAARRLTRAARVQAPPPPVKREGQGSAAAALPHAAPAAAPDKGARPAPGAPAAAGGGGALKGFAGFPLETLHVGAAEARSAAPRTARAACAASQLTRARPPTRAQPMGREARVLRYKEKRKNRKFDKTIRCAHGRRAGCVRRATASAAGSRAC